MTLRPFAAPLCPMHFFFNEITRVIGGRSELGRISKIMKTLFSIGNPASLQLYLVQLLPEERLTEFNSAALKGHFLVFTRETKVFGHVLFLEKEHIGDRIIEMEFAFYDAKLDDIADAMNILLRDVEATRVQGKACFVHAKHDGTNGDFVRIMHGKGFHSPTDVLLVKQFKKKPSS